MSDDGKVTGSALQIVCISLTFVLNDAGLFLSAVKDQFCSSRICLKLSLTVSLHFSELLL